MDAEAASPACSSIVGVPLAGTLVEGLRQGEGYFETFHVPPAPALASHCPFAPALQ